MKKHLKLLCLATLAAAIFGCGDESAITGPVADNTVLPAGKTTLTFSAMSTTQLNAPISGIDLTLVLPQGMAVATTTGTSGQIESATLTAGSSLSSTNLAFGSYSASTRKAYLSMATTSAAYRSGEFLRLICTVAPNTAITLADIKAQNSPVSMVKAVGYDAATKSTVVLTGNLKITLGAVR